MTPNNRIAALVASAFILLPMAASNAQSRWKEIGKTASNNIVYVDPRSVTKTNGIVTARVRVKFITPVESPKGTFVQSQHIAMFDCAKSTVAAKETTYYADERGTRVVDKSIVGKPGFGSPIGGSMTKVALDYLCKTP